MTVPFASRWHALAARRTPLCLGVAPSAKWLARWNLAGDLTGARAYCRTVLDAAGDALAGFKVQVPFFEQFGPDGFALLRWFTAEAHARGSLVVLDGKLGDAADTMDALGAAYLGPDSWLAGDAVTANAFMGFPSLDPLCRHADDTGSAVLVLVRTSNHAADSVQRTTAAGGRTVAEMLADDITEWNRRWTAPGGVGPVGAVVGARMPESLDLVSRLPLSIVEVPGLGRADRATGEVLAAVRPLGAARVMVPVTTGVLAAGPDVIALREALRRWRDEVGSAASSTNADPDADAAPGTGTDAAATARVELSGGGLHGSVTDPLLDTMTFLNDVTARYPDAISFAPGRPWDETFAMDDVVAYVRSYVDHRGGDGGGRRVERDLLQYGATAGAVRDLIAAMLDAEEGIRVPPEAVVVTVGCQEAMLVTLRALFASPADVLVVGSPCYAGIAGAARLLDIPVVTVAEGGDGLPAAGLDRAAAELACQGRRVRACYVVPEAANPSGTTMPVAARHALLNAADRHDALVLEDSPYRMFAGDDRPPALKALDRTGRVVLLGSFAKTVLPGLRMGYVVADQPVRHAGDRTTLLAAEITKIKSMVTVSTPGITQAAVGGFLLRNGLRLSGANAAAAERYRAVLERIVATLGRCFPPAVRAATGVEWNRPTGGFFLTVRVPFRADLEALHRSAMDYGVIWTPMSYFHLDGGGTHAIRLSCSYLTPDRAEEGIHRLARLIADVAPADRAAPAVAAA